MIEADLRTTVYELGFQPSKFITSWGNYAHPSPRWVRKMAGWLVVVSKALKIAGYKDGALNCKIFSDLAKGLAQANYGQTATEAKQPAIGAFYFMHRSGEYHAALLVIHNRKSYTVLDLTFLLNGGEALYQLTPEEIASCKDFLYF